MRGKETLTILRAPGRDYNGDPIGDVEEIEIKNCLVWARTSTEDDERGIVPISGLGAWLPAGTEILASDRVRARGEEYEVEGVPADHRKFSGKPWGVQIALERVGV